MGQFTDYFSDLPSQLFPSLAPISSPSPPFCTHGNLSLYDLSQSLPGITYSGIEQNLDSSALAL